MKIIKRQSTKILTIVVLSS